MLKKSSIILIIAMPKDRTRWIVGAMTGTSLDGIDTALACVRGSGLKITAELTAVAGYPIADPLGQNLRQLAAGNPTRPIETLRAARALGQLHADAIEDLLHQERVSNPGFAPDLIAAHGQTLWHAPDEGLSWQLLDPWPIVRRLGVPVVYDLRQADLIAGGQGAPITPLSDWVLFRDPTIHRIVVNLGGVCNVTELTPGCDYGEIRGYDVGPCNLLIDGLVRRLWLGRAFDDRGRLAASGRADPSFRSWMHRTSGFYRRRTPRSTGREDFNDDWLDRLVHEADRIDTPHDLLACAVDAVACDVADHVRNAKETAALGPGHRVEVILAGGGAKNDTLVNQIRRYAGGDAQVRLSDELGVPVSSREALGMAVLGALTQDGVPISLGHVTGADRPQRAGVWVYP